MLSASIGATFQLASKVYSSSYTCCMIVPTRSAVDAIGSSVCGSPIIAMLAAPPRGGAASAALPARAIAAATTIVAMARSPRPARTARPTGTNPGAKRSMGSPWRPAPDAGAVQHLQLLCKLITPCEQSTPERRPRQCGRSRSRTCNLLSPRRAAFVSPTKERPKKKAHGGFTAMCSANAASDSGRCAQPVLRRFFIKPNAASPTASSATVSGSGTAGVTGTSTAVPCTPTVKPFQNSFVELRHVTVSNAPLN